MSQERSDTLVLFGATGDLAHKKIFPALYQMVAKGTLTEPVIGVAFDPWDIGKLQARAHDGIVNALGSVDEKVFAKLASQLRYVSGDYRDGATFEKLKAALGSAQRPLHYMAVPPTMFETVVQGLEQSGTAHGARLMVEKPFGHDLQSARWLNRVLHLVFDEQSIFRIDHYLGKETVQNLMALRFANALYEPLWNSANVDHVQITVAETVGLEDRVTYYDKAGALRDMVQNHMLQLLCLVAMEAPSSMDADAVRDEKLKVLRALKRVNGNEAPKHTVRGQYRAGASAGGPVKGYVEELGKDSNTETFVAIKAEIGNWRWSGVPFYLRTGKRLATRVSEIVIEFKPIPHSIFGDSAGPIFANQLVIRLQPDEGVKQFIMIKDPGPGGMRLRQIPLDMSFAQSFDGRAPDAYERLIMDVVRGNQTLFMRRDEVEAAWKWIDPIQNAWESARQEAQGYTAGTWGPSASIALIERDGRTWHESN